MSRRARWQRYWTAVGVIPRWQLVLVYALIVGAGVFGFATTSHQAGRTTEALREIQQQRLAVCRDQNARHDRTIKQLDQLIAHVPPRQRSRAQRSRAGTIALINTLAPKRNCAPIARVP